MQISVEMQRKIIAIATAKGGVGKTTTAINLYWILAQSVGAQNVILVDADSKTSTATVWTGLRSNNPDLMPILTVQKTGDKDFIQAIKMLNEKYRYVIIDVGGDNETELLASMVVASELYVLTRPSFIDTFSFYALDKKIGQAQASLNPNLQAYLLPSVVSPNKLMVADDLKEVEELVSELENIKLVENYIYDRKAYRRSPKFNGKTIFELTPEEKFDREACNEMFKFAQEAYGK